MSDEKLSDEAIEVLAERMREVEEGEVEFVTIEELQADLEARDE